jgi:hypothetical protein
MTETRGASAVMAESPRLEDLQAEARYARERYDLYKAKMYGPRPTSEARLRELERALKGAEANLRRAQEAPDSGAAS